MKYKEHWFITVTLKKALPPTIKTFVSNESKLTR